MRPVKTVSGTVKLPGSKSLSNRILLLAALAEGTTLVRNLLVRGASFVECCCVSCGVSARVVCGARGRVLLCAVRAAAAADAASSMRARKTRHTPHTQ